MARGRIISKSLSTSQRFLALQDAEKGAPPNIWSAGKLAEFCQLLFGLVVIHTDDFGRLQGDAQTVKFLVFPGSPRKLPEFETALVHLHNVELITLYTDDSGRIYLQVNNFEPHQSGLHKRTKSRFPDPPPGKSGKLRDFPGNSRSTELNLREEKGRELKTQIVPDQNNFSDPTDTWQRVVTALDCNDRTKDAFLRPCSLIRETDELIEVGAPNKVIADFLRTQYSKTLKETMAGVCAGKGLSVVVLKPKTAKAS